MIEGGLPFEKCVLRGHAVDEEAINDWMTERSLQSC